MSPIREIHLKTIADVLRSLKPGDDEDSVFQREAAEAHIRELYLASPASGAGQQEALKVAQKFQDRLVGEAYEHHSWHLWWASIQFPDELAKVLTSFAALAASAPAGQEPRVVPNSRHS